MKNQIKNKINNNWDLEIIYPSFNVWLNDYHIIETKINNFDIYKNKVVDKLYEAITELLDIERKLNRLTIYAKLKHDLNCLNDENNLYYNMSQKIINLFSYKTDFITIEINNIADSKLKNIYDNEDRLLPYQFLIAKIRCNKKHYLSLKEENILSLSSDIRSTQERIFDNINDADVNFGKINNIDLTHGNYHNFISNKDQNIRKKAFTTYHKYYQNHSNALGECLVTQVKNNIFESNLRKFNSPLEMYLNYDKIDKNVYDKLIEEVHNNIDLLHDYMKIKKDTLKLDQINMYDLYVPLNEADNKKYTYEEAKSIVLNSLKPMGNEYIKMAKNGLDNNLVDVYPAKGKTSGAYSSGCYDTIPYILLNFNDSFNSVETLAHELGHSMHSYYANKTQPYHYSDYSIFLAEIASNTHELLLFDYVKKQAKTIKEKKYIIELILDSFKSSIFRQTQFAEFEKIIHNYELNGNILTKNKITDIYFDLNNFYYGKIVKQNDLIRYESLRIPHFYSSFYVYKYAIGLSIAHVFAKNIIDKKAGAVENYIKFISSGSSKYPLEVLKDANINMDNVINDALLIMRNYINEYKKLN